jgi:Bifunctional DNA primase/polymerase, N-terminal
LSAYGEAMPSVNPVLDCALRLAGEGIAVFPCIYAAKEPATRRGFYDATTNPATIRRWFGGNYPRNLAIRTGQASGVWVLDIDDPDALTVLAERHGPLPATRQSRSSRGYHFWFKTTVIPIPCSTGRVAADVDVRGELGCAMAPPSVHPTGVVYEWIDDGPIAEPPSWLLVLARKPVPPPPRPTSPAVAGRFGAYGEAALKAEIAILAGTPKGGRNHQLNRSAFSLFQLVAGGELNAGAVEQQLIAACTANGLVADDGPRAVLATIASGRRAGLLQPRTRPGRAA